jgi:hypothetical protein
VCAIFIHEFNEKLLEIGFKGSKKEWLHLKWLLLA